MVAIVGKFRNKAQCVVVSKFSPSNSKTPFFLLFTVSLLFGSGSFNIAQYYVFECCSLCFNVWSSFFFSHAVIVFISQRVPMNESDMNSRINSIFMSVLFMCVSSQNTVLSVFETERNMFYRHKNAKMYGTGAIVRAFTFAEMPFILMTSTAFTLIFYFFMG